MSLKLGNTNIAGTQILYSTTGNNTDGAMTQAVTTTQLNLKANDADVVHKTGDETVSGVKTFNDAVFTNSSFNKTFNITRGTAPSIVRQGEIAIGKDINGLGLGNFYYYHGTDNSNNVGIHCYDPTKSEGYTNASIQIGYNKNGGVFTTAPACDNGNSIVTTISKSKTQNGYFKLGNGLIIQWGRSSTTDGYVSFPTPFSNACTAVIPTRISSGDAQSNIFENASTTRFKVKIYGGYSSSSYFYWIAVGY